MKLKLLIALILLIYAPVRPPALTPSDIPFIYDPNMVTSDILKYLEVRPSNSMTDLPIKTIEVDGEYGTLTCNDPNVIIPPAITTIDPDDPNGISRIHSYMCGIRVGLQKRVVYLEFTFTDDPNGEDYAPMSDMRTVLIDVQKRNRRPILKWWNF